MTVTVAATTAAEAQPIDSLRVMSYNIWVGGAAFGPLSRTVGVIQTAQADVIGIQEVGGSAQAIANALGYYYHGFNSDLAIVSRYPIVEVAGSGVKLQLSAGQLAYVFDAHLAPYPYQPYDIRDGLITTEAQAISAAQSARGGSVTSLLGNMSAAQASGMPVFLVGDFNEPSHLDWTQEAADAGLHFGMKVEWPASRAIANAGLTDAFRQLRPDEVADRGDTWTPGYPAPNLDFDEVQDRIDFVYYAGLNVTPVSAEVLGYDVNDGSTDVGIQPYPSDHRSLVVDFDIPTSCSILGDLNGDCGITATDWAQLRGAQHTDLTGLTPSQAYALGDLNGDFRNDYADFVIFKTAFETANGAGTFASMLLVPEPASLALVSIVAALLLATSRRRY